MMESPREGVRSTPLSEQELSALRQRTLDALASLPERIGRYEVRGELGHGGMGIVYDAYDPRLDRPVAIKVIHHERLRAAKHPELAARFEREMRATSELFHANLVAILDAGIEPEGDPPRAYYVMERICGDSLEQRLRRRGALAPADALRIAAQVARGLAAAHAHGLVHRDLKPANVLLPEGGEAKVADFGLCALRADLAELDGSNALLGSAHYAAPEQILRRAADSSADLFSLGGVLLRSLTGRDPFPAPTLEAHLGRILRDPPEGLGELPPELRGVVAELMAKEPAQRPSCAGEVAESLEALQIEFASRVEARAPVRRWLSRALAVCGSLMALAGLWAHNELVALDTAAELQWRQVENQLARKRELLPRLEDITRRFAEHESTLLGQLLEGLRPLLENQGSAAAPSAQTESLLGHLDRIASRFPELAADRHFRALFHEVAGTANRVAVEQMRYNEAAGTLNRRLRQLPWRLVALWIEPRRYLDASLGATSANAREAARERDASKILSSEQRAALDKRFAQVFRGTGIDVHLAFVNSIESAAHARGVFAAASLDRLAEQSRSPEQRVLLILYDAEFERLRVEVGYGLESLLPDAFVADLVERHVRTLFATGEPELALRLMIRMLEHRILDAQLARSFDLHPAAMRRARYASGGAGAAAVAPLGQRGTAPMPAPSARATVGAAPSAAGAHDRYLAWLASDSFDPSAELFTAESRAELAAWPMTPAYSEFAFEVEASQRVQIIERGDLALVVATNDPRACPLFLRRSAVGWQVDLAAAREHVLRMAGGAYTWTLRPRRTPYTDAFAQDLVWVGGFLRLRAADNRALRVFQPEGPGPSAPAVAASS